MQRKQQLKNIRKDMYVYVSVFVYKITKVFCPVVFVDFVLLQVNTMFIERTKLFANALNP